MVLESRRIWVWIPILSQIYYETLENLFNHSKLQMICLKNEENVRTYFWVRFSYFEEANIVHKEQKSASIIHAQKLLAVNIIIIIK